MEESLVEPRNLSPRIKIRWFANWAVYFFPVVATIYLIVYVLLPQYGLTIAIHHETLLIFFTVAIMLFLLLVDELRYRRYLYSLMPTELVIEKGIVEKIRYIIPYEKIQNVNVSRDVSDRILGLCTLHIQTAAHSSRENLMLLPGISESLDLDQRILILSKAAREHKDSGRAADPEKAILEAILHELREIRHSMQVTRSPSKDSDEKGIMLERLRGKGKQG